jgi:hypothetical protein
LQSFASERYGIGADNFGVIMSKIIAQSAPPSEAGIIGETLPAPPSPAGFKSEKEQINAAALRGAEQVLNAVKNPAIQSPFLDEKQILELVPVCRRTWWGWKSKGIIPYIKIGRKCLYDLESVRRALLRMQRGG